MKNPIPKVIKQTNSINGLVILDVDLIIIENGDATIKPKIPQCVALGYLFNNLDIILEIIITPATIPIANGNNINAPFNTSGKLNWTNAFIVPLIVFNIRL